jgi:hypothetical protein
MVKACAYKKVQRNEPKGQSIKNKQCCQYCQQWVHKTQDEDKTKKNNKENQKDEDHGQLSAHEGLSVPASY